MDGPEGIAEFLGWQRRDRTAKDWHMTHFQPELFSFLVELKENNTKEWFQTNKDRYRSDVQEPLIGFISAFAEPLHAISSNFVADPRPSGGSMFRIYRDVRFSRDKSPYKVHAAAQFRHREGRDVHAPGFYLHLEPGRVFMGAGLWHPDGPTLTAIRSAIVDDPNRWLEVSGDLELGGESLKRGPRGIDPDHPLIEDLKRKDFVSFTSTSQEAVLEPGFLDAFVDNCRAVSPFMGYLTEAVDLEF
jgi:uncharacterized protein (TIGR02453 family)